jgi:hypothetical protein
LLRCSQLQGARFYSLPPALSSASQTKIPMSFYSTSALSATLSGLWPFHLLPICRPAKPFLNLGTLSLPALTSLVKRSLSSRGLPLRSFFSCHRFAVSSETVCSSQRARFYSFSHTSQGFL